MSVPTVLTYFTVKRFFSSKTDDWIDKLNHAYTSTLILSFAVIISTTQFVGEPIHCWTPAEFTGAYESYTKSYCWIKNTYYIPMMDVMPTDIGLREGSEITYYQWTPLILLFMAFLFKFPNLLWRILNSHTGLNLAKIMTIADNCICSSPSDRKNNVEILSFCINKWLTSHHYYDRSFLTRAKSAISRWVCFICNKREGKYLTAVYISIKMVYVINVILQFYMLNIFLGMDFGSFGYEVLDSLAKNEDIRESPRFPRVTLCDFQIRQLQNIQRFTVQCVLPVNLFNEKIFIFCWFWFFMLAILSCFNFAKWMYLLVIKKNNYVFVKKYLKAYSYIKSERDKKLCRRFANHYLRDDGCFVLRMIALNSTDMVVLEVLDQMWNEYRQQRSRTPSTETELMKESGHVPYIDEDHQPEHEQ